MAIQQPVSTNTLASPDHSLSHRVFANDDAAPAQSVVVDAAGRATINKLTGMALRLTPQTQTTTYQILSTDGVVICNSVGGFAATLPTDPTVGQVHIIKNIGVGLITVAPTAGTIDGEPSMILGQYDALLVYYAATNVWVIL